MYLVSCILYPMYPVSFILLFVACSLYPVSNCLFVGVWPRNPPTYKYNDNDNDNDRDDGNANDDDINNDNVHYDRTDQRDYNFHSDHIDKYDHDDHVDHNSDNNHHTDHNDYADHDNHNGHNAHNDHYGTQTFLQQLPPQPPSNSPHYPWRGLQTRGGLSRVAGLGTQPRFGLTPHTERPGFP